MKKLMYVFILVCFSCAEYGGNEDDPNISSLRHDHPNQVTNPDACEGNNCPTPPSPPQCPNCPWNDESCKSKLKCVTKCEVNYDLCDEDCNLNCTDDISECLDTCHSNFKECKTSCSLEHTCKFNIL